MEPQSLSQSGEPDFKLGEWWVRPQRNVLERGQEEAHVEARSMGVLVVLARRAPEVVSKERLLKEVWADSPFVGEEVLSHAIWELRKALGDPAREPRYVETIPRKGYRLVAEVTRVKGAALPVSGVQINHYDLGEELGRGAMGVVYAAVDRRLDRPVAIKFLASELTRDPAALQRFEREARLAASLDHPNLATVLEIGETKDGHRYLVTPLYRGGSLKERLAQGPIPVEEAIKLARQLAAGLGAAHQREIVHRDIKPANLLLDEHGTLKIADFGIAKLLGATDLTRTGATLGTPAYKSPEQSRGEPVDHRSDLWSLGVVLFEMLTGRRPFDGEYEQAVVHAIIAGEPRPFESADGRAVPEGLRRIVVKAMAKDPAERYQSAQQIIEDLEALGAWPAVQERSRRSWKVPVAALLAAVATLSMWLISSSQQYTPPREAIVQLEQGQTLWLRGNDARNLAETEEKLKAAVRTAPAWAKAVALLAVFKADRFALTRNQKELSQARDLIEEARGLDPQEPLIWVAEARLSLLVPDAPAAEAMASKAVQREPSCNSGGSCDLAYVWLGEALWKQGEREAALETLSEGLGVGGGRIRCRLKLAQLYKNDGDTTQAMAAYEAVLGLDSTQSTALNDLGYIYLTDNDYEKAGALFRSLYEKTQDPKAALNLGHALYGQKRWEDAIGYYQQADELFKALGDLKPTPAVSIGDALLELGREQEASEYFAKALLQFDELMQVPEVEPARKAQRAVCLAKLKRFEEAEAEIRELLSGSKNFPDVFFYAARIYAVKRDWENLSLMARRAVEAGCPPHRLSDDAAFIAYREDPSYRRLLEPPRLAGR